jgi:hypothetical protein
LIKLFFYPTFYSYKLTHFVKKIDAEAHNVGLYNLEGCITPLHKN